MLTLNEWPPVYDRSYVPSLDSKYWNQELETMDPEEREQKIILPKLQAQLKYAYENSPFYRKKWGKVGIKPEDVRSLADFEQIPFLTKDEIRGSDREPTIWHKSVYIEKGNCKDKRNIRNYRETNSIWYQ